MVIQVDDRNFDHEVLHASRPVVVLFWTPLIPSSMYQQVADVNEGRAIFASADLGGAEGAAKRYDVESLPMTLLFKGGQVRGRLHGLPQPYEVQQLLDDAG